MPFARLDVILLLIKTCLKGPIVDMLNKKDNQVFLDYLAGRQNGQISQVGKTQILVLFIE